MKRTGLIVLCALALLGACATGGGNAPASSDASLQSTVLEDTPAYPNQDKDDEVTQEVSQVIAIEREPPIDNSTSLSMPSDYLPAYIHEKLENYKAEFGDVSDSQYRFFYTEDGAACLDLPQYIYTWFNVKGSIGNNETLYTKTRKMYDEAEYRIEERRKEAVFREIEEIVYRVAKDLDYDFESAYGIRVQYRNPNVRKAVCDGYADAVSEAFDNHPYIVGIEKWSSAIGNHAWNVLLLKDGRKLYCDVTWYEEQRIDDEGYVVDVPAQDPVNLTFDLQEFNSLGGAVDDSTGNLLEVHFAWGDAVMK